jgi:hypothetical protein
VVVEILRRVLPAAVENVGVNGYESEHGIHQPNVTNLHIKFFYIMGSEIVFFLSGGSKSWAVSVQNRKKTYGKNKKM